MEGVERGSADRNEDLEQRVEAMKREVDALQVQVMEQTKPWWRENALVLFSLLISLGAVGFSFWTNQNSEDRLDRKEEHELRVELRGLVQRLQALPKENYEFAKENPEAQFGGFTTTEKLVLTRQAAELIDELDGEVSATEYYAVAYAFSDSDLPGEASDLLTRGLEVAEDPINEASLLRQDALVRFALGDLEGGRRRWQQALDIFEKYPEPNAIIVAGTHMYTEVSWATAELGQGKCREAWKHLAAAKEHMSYLSQQHPTVAQLYAAETNINNNKRCASQLGT